MDEDLLARIMSSPRLPTLPKVAFRILQLVQTPDVSIEELSNAIAIDPALAAKILKTANSGMYGRVRSVAKLRDAIMILGLRNVKTLALGFSLVSDLKGSAESGLDYAAFWRRSVVAACAARALAYRVNRQEQDEAFLGGLMHAIGIVALDRAVGPRYQAIAAHLGRGIDALAAIERQRIGVSHVEVGMRLATTWNLPAMLTGSITHYPEPGLAPTELRLLAQCVSLGAQAGDVACGIAPGPALGRFRSSAAGLALGEGEADALLREALENASLLQQVFDSSPADRIAPAELLARANDALLELNMEYAQETERLESENELLTRDAATDALTGLANRRSFDQFLTQQTEISARYGPPLSLIMIDIDHFKVVNDSYGHIIGDAVLRNVAARIQRAVRAADFVARWGGEEFVVALPGTLLAGAIETAERIRTAIAADSSVAVDEVPVRVTVSLGVALLDAGKGSAGLITAADAALYRAKAAGRDRVAGSDVRAAA
ncbi:MAG: diguanylate cyclase [Tepidiformaceae bacterium]